MAVFCLWTYRSLLVFDIFVLSEIYLCQIQLLLIRKEIHQHGLFCFYWNQLTWNLNDFKPFLIAALFPVSVGETYGKYRRTHQTHPICLLTINRRTSIPFHRNQNDEDSFTCMGKWTMYSYTLAPKVLSEQKTRLACMFLHRVRTVCLEETHTEKSEPGAVLGAGS